MKENQVIEILSSILEIITDNMPLLRSHTAYFLTENSYEKLICSNTRTRLESLTIQKIRNLPIEAKNGKLTEILKQPLPNLANCFPPFCVSDLQNAELLDNCCDKTQMSRKKFHEVVRIGHFLECNSRLLNHNVVDLGSGKGYLSDYLSQFLQYRVVGVETCDAFNDSAAKRRLKVSRIWRKMEFNRKKKAHDEPNDSFENIRDRELASKSDKDRDTQLETRLRDNFNASLVEKSYEIKTDYITSGSDLSEIFPGESFSLVGLHTCGDLAASSLRLFVKSENCRFICNVGCCYNTLTEEGNERGFPMSQFLNAYFSEELGTAKTLACLSPEKQIDGGGKDPLPKMFNRALLQKLVLDKTGYSLDHRQQFSKKKAARSFLEYCKYCIPLIEVEDKHFLQDLSDSDIENFEQINAPSKHQMFIFNHYRACFAYLLEHLFLLDRLLFLRENGIEESEVAQLFDPKLSPRCYAVVASKMAP